MILHLRRTAPFALAGALAALLAGCNAGPQAGGAPAVPVAVAVPPPASAYASERFAPDGFKLPQGAGCSGDIARYDAIVEDDFKTGNVAQSVYTVIQGDLKKAAAACSSGHDSEARAMIHTSRVKHGYEGRG